MTPEFYILNNIDKPEPRHVAQSISKTELVYIHEELRNWESRYGAFNFREETTNMQDFGFDIEIIDDMAVFVKVKSSEAKYTDGGNRHWQGEYNFVLRLKPMLEDRNK